MTPGVVVGVSPPPGMEPFNIIATDVSNRATSIMGFLYSFFITVNLLIFIVLLHD